VLCVLMGMFGRWPLLLNKSLNLEFVVLKRLEYKTCIYVLDVWMVQA